MVIAPTFAESLLRTFFSEGLLSAVFLSVERFSAVRLAKRGKGMTLPLVPVLAAS
jgi:hypothetical protein